MLHTRKPPRCKVCRERTEGLPLHDHCVEAWVRIVREKKAKAMERKLAEARRNERRRDRVRKEALKPISQIEDECRRIVQKIARIRDRHLGCISCDKPANWDGQWHGSHFRSHGGCSSLQFHLWNISKACWICNKIFSGRIDQYERGLVERHGQERVDWLKAQPKSRKFSREYLLRFKQVMGKRLRRLERSARKDQQ